MRLLVAVLTLVAIVFAAMSVPGAPSPVLAAGSYVYPCSDYGNYKETIWRGAGLPGGTGTDFTGVIGDITANSPGTCTNSVEPIISAILPANLQNDPYIIQSGLAVCTGPSGQKCGDTSTGIPTDGLLHFVYICSDASGGVPCLADGWVGHAPTYHDRYRFRIEKSGSSWLYTIQDVSIGWTKTKTIPRSSAFTQGNLVWWAAETYDLGSQLGTGQASASMMKMYWTQYFRTSLGSWYVAWPDTQYIDYPNWSSWPSYWLGSVYSQNYTNDAQNIWTILH
jgi:hypothetical protein